MDCLMPELDGYAATEAIRRHELELNLKRIPICGISASAFKENRDRCITSGMDDFLPKPFAATELRKLLATIFTANAATDVHSEHPAVSARRVDREALRQAVEALAPLLEKGKFDALQRFDELLALAAGTDISHEIEDIGSAVKAFQFRPALKRLRALVDDLPERIAP
jgi:CheY-like chemotaxis protein